MAAFPPTGGYDPWPYWQVTTTAASNIYINATWQTWCNQTNATILPTQGTVAVTDNTWTAWTGVHYATGQVIQQVGPTTWEAREPTERELAEQKRRAYIARVRSRSFDLRRRVANRAAKRLLLDHLRAEQRAELEQHDYFHVVTADGQRRYRIRIGTHGNVRRVRGDGVEDRSYCIQPNGVPTYDAMLAQALMLETDETEFLRVANERVLVR
jgi:hypothetical protein